MSDRHDNATWRPRPILGDWTEDQRRVAACLPTHTRVAVPAANGVGKTYLAADLVVSFIADMPQAQIIITAPTNRQVSQLLWPHVTERLLLLGLADETWVIPTKPKWRGGDGDNLVGFATNRPEKLQGYHAEHLLIIVDEASGMPAELLTALEGIAIAPKNYIFAIGNPNTPDCAFYNMTRLPSWHTEEISALTHPNITSHKEVIPGATSWHSLLARVADWCKPSETSSPETFSLTVSDYELLQGQDRLPRLRHFIPNDAFKIRYLGKFPNTAEWQLIARDLINEAQARSFEGGTKTAALDVARTGGDRSVYVLRTGDAITRIDILTPADLITQAQQCADILSADQPSSLTVDCAGIGVGLLDALRQKTDVPLMMFNGAETPCAPSQQRRYSNRRTAAYASLQQAFEQKRIAIPKNQDLADELAAMKFKYLPDNRMQMLRKEEVKRTLGRSPDLADAVSIAWEFGADVPSIPANSPTFRRPEMELW